VIIYLLFELISDAHLHIKVLHKENVSHEFDVVDRLGRLASKIQDADL
jgi:hypothetical protein